MRSAFVTRSRQCAGPFLRRVLCSPSACGGPSFARRGDGPLHAAHRALSLTPSRFLQAGGESGDAASTREAAPARLTAERFAALTPMVLLEAALRQHTMLAGTAYAGQHEPSENHVVISRERFDEFCALSHVADSQAALEALEAAAVVVSLEGGTRVHLRPVQYLEELEVLEALQHRATSTTGGTAASSSSSSTAAAASSSFSSEAALSDMPLPPPFLLAEVDKRVEELERQEVAMRQRLAPAIARAARWRRSIWGGALLYAGAQLAVIARLTYFDLDWDTMEPVSYCLTIGTALIFYLYYLYFDAEHTYSDFDKRFLPRRVHKYAPADFDWAAYDKLCQELADERAMRERLRAWASTH